MEGMVEPTIIKRMQLPDGGKPYRWHADANVVVLDSRLDQAGCLAALFDLFTEWRKTMLRIAA